MRIVLPIAAIMLIGCGSPDPVPHTTEGGSEQTSLQAPSLVFELENNDRETVAVGIPFSDPEKKLFMGASLLPYLDSKGFQEIIKRSSAILEQLHGGVELQSILFLQRDIFPPSLTRPCVAAVRLDASPRIVYFSKVQPRLFAHEWAHANLPLALSEQLPDVVSEGIAQFAEQLFEGRVGERAKEVQFNYAEMNDPAYISVDGSIDPLLEWAQRLLAMELCSAIFSHDPNSIRTLLVQVKTGIISSWSDYCDFFRAHLPKGNRYWLIEPASKTVSVLRHTDVLRASEKYVVFISRDATGRLIPTSLTLVANNGRQLTLEIDGFTSMLDNEFWSIFPDAHEVEIRTVERRLIRTLAR
jgi:hypothetical protein